MRSHTCGELRREHAGRAVDLVGWVQSVRDHGNLVFVDLRDRYGRTQLLFRSGALLEQARGLKTESVVRVAGKVETREADKTNPKLPTGEVEIVVQTLEVVNPCKPLPFEIVDDVDPGLEMRLAYRYLDLRREKCKDRLILRHEIIAAMRRHLWSRQFIEFETPYLYRQTPEGARDYIVPSRIQPGSFYALPQSPQLLKQILMVSGMDRYFQVVRCFRDEDLRADRQPEFTQMDLEMSFVSQDDVLGVIEGTMQYVLKEVLGRELTLPIQRMSFDEAMNRFGTDAPDLRFGLELVDAGPVAAKTEFRVFRDALAAGGQVKGIRIPGGAARSRKEITDLEDYAKQFGAKGLAWAKVKEGQLDGPIAKFFGDGPRQELLGAFAAESGDLLVFVADAKPSVVAASLDKVRRRLGKELGLTDPSVFRFVWIVDFPLYEYSEEQGRWVSRHHPFTSPRAQDLDRIEADPASIYAQAYDLVMNGFELGGGSIRIHRRDLQERIFRFLGFEKERMETMFGWFLRCLEYGAPPHGGIALGVDRTVMLLAQTDNIREVIAFPKTARAADPLTGAPAPVEDRILQDLGIRVVSPAGGAAAAGS